MSYIEKEKLIKADIASIENRVRHAFNQGYDLGFKDGKNNAAYRQIKSDNSVLEDIKAQIPNLARYESADGQDLIMAYDMARLIDEYISGKEQTGENT